jgi:hypothetical protein
MLKTNKFKSALIMLAMLTALFAMMSTAVSAASGSWEITPNIGDNAEETPLLFGQAPIEVTYTVSGTNDAEGKFPSGMTIATDNTNIKISAKEYNSTNGEGSFTVSVVNAPIGEVEEAEITITAKLLKVPKVNAGTDSNGDATPAIEAWEVDEAEKSATVYISREGTDLHNPVTVVNSSGDETEYPYAIAAEAPVVYKSSAVLQKEEAKAGIPFNGTGEEEDDPVGIFDNGYPAGKEVPVTVWMEANKKKPQSLR